MKKKAIDELHKEYLTALRASHATNRLLLSTIASQEREIHALLDKIEDLKNELPPK